jgi:hypothetical protein
MFYKVYDKRINTPEGFKSFAGVQTVKKKGQFVISLYNGKNIKCSPNHRLMTKNGWVFAINLKNDDILIGKGFESKIFFIDYLEGEFEYYDIIGVENSQFYANDILSHNCEFLGSANTLIHPNKLRSLAFKRPIKSNDLGFKMYEEPQKDVIYTIVVDTSRGAGADYSAFIVVNVSTFPYKVIATFRNNLISPLVYPTIVHDVAKLYNNALILVETNDIGQQVADIIHYDLEYENLLVSANSGRAGQTLSGGFATTTHYGIRTTQQVKRIGCATLKTLIESDKFIIEDYDIIYELSRFTLKGKSYEAEEGNDDLAMCCVLFSWLTTQPYLKEITDLDIRKKIVEQNERMLEEEMLPFGMYSSGDEEEDAKINIPVSEMKDEFKNEFVGGVSSDPPDFRIL